MRTPPSDVGSRATRRPLALAAPLIVASVMACAAEQGSPVPARVARVAPAPVAPTPPPPASGVAAAAPEPPPATTSESPPPAPAAPLPPPAPPPLTVSLADEAPFLPAPASRAKSETPPKPAAEDGASAKRHTHAHLRKGHRPYHPDPGIIVDVAQPDAQRIARASGYWPFRHCYEEGLRRDQKLAGHVSMELTLRADGSVEFGRITESSLADESVALCVLREAGHLPPLSPAADGEIGAPRELAIRVALAVGDAPVPTPKVAPHADDLRDALRDNWPAAERCYESGLEQHRDLGGRLALRLRVGSSGEVEEAQEYETRFSDVEVTRCVLGVYRGAKLTPVKRSLDIVYAMHFEAKPTDPVEGASARR
jgi:hypothetical protein